MYIFFGWCSSHQREICDLITSHWKPTAVGKMFGRYNLKNCELEFLYARNFNRNV